MSEAVTIALPPPDPMRDMIAEVERAQRRVILTRDGAPVAAIIPIADLHALQELDEAEDAHWNRVADEAIAQWEAEGRPPGISHQELLARYGIDPGKP